MERMALENKVEEARKELAKLSPICKEAEKELRKISKQIDYWANIKYETEKKLVKVQKIAATEQPAKRRMKVKKNPSFEELISNLGSITSFEKEKLIEALTP